MRDAQPAPVPTFALYGEDDWHSPPGFAHIETIATRSALHDWLIAPHRHDRAVQLLLVQDGAARVTLNGAPFDLIGPAFIVVPVDVVHGFAFSPGTDGHVLTLSQEFAGRSRIPGDPLVALLTGGGHGEITGAALARTAWLTAELLALAPHAAGADPLFETLAEALVRSLTAGAAPASGDRRLALFRHLVETHLAEHRSLDFYATSIGTTVRTLTRLTQSHLGTSPQALINRRLALEAQRMLRFSKANVTRVAAELGFADPSYFSRFYLRMTGHRPYTDITD